MAANCGVFPSRLYQSSEQMAIPSRRVALGVFALIIVGAPLLFGASDRVWQIPLVLALGAGLFFEPPEIPKLRRAGACALAAVVAVFLLKEFAPAVLFGRTAWRETLTREFS